MIKLFFEKSGAYFIITIDNKKILYWDKLQGAIWKTSLQYLPKDPTVQQKILLSRNKIPAQFIDLFNIPSEELAEFEAAKDDNELKELVLKDAKKNNCRLIDMKID